MSIDNLTWHAMVGVFNAFTIKSKRKLSGDKPSLLLSTLVVLLKYTIAKQLNLAHYLITCFTSKTIKNYKNHFTLLFITKTSKLTNVLVLFAFYGNIFLLCCGDIEINPGPKFSS